MEETFFNNRLTQSIRLSMKCKKKNGIVACTDYVPINECKSTVIAYIFLGLCYDHTHIICNRLNCGVLQQKHISC